MTTWALGVQMRLLFTPEELKAMGRQLGIEGPAGVNVARTFVQVAVRERLDRALAEMKQAEEER